MSNEVKVQTMHIQQLIEGGLLLAQTCQGSGRMIPSDAVGYRGGQEEVPTDWALSRASNLLRHAAEELEDERQRLLGWP